MSSSIIKSAALAALISTASAAVIPRAGGLQFVLESPFGAETTINAYISGQINGKPAFVNANGGVYYVPGGGSSTPTTIANSDIAISYKGNSPKTITLPSTINSGRIFYSLNSTLEFGYVQDSHIVSPSTTDQASPNYKAYWAFAEFYYNTQNAHLDLDPSAVDLASLPVAYKVYGTNGQQVGPSIQQDKMWATPICNAMKAQTAKDGYPWDKLCYSTQYGVNRVISPGDYTALGSNTGFENYWTDYVNSVFTKYESETLTLDNGASTCKTSGSTMTCTGAYSATIGKPSAFEIFACTGNAAHPSICAGYNRATLLKYTSTPTGPVSDFYTNSVTNHYAKAVHANELNGLGYAFAYDDSTADGVVNQSGNTNNDNIGKVVYSIGA